jgi:hypothetical protein
MVGSKRSGREIRNMCGHEIEIVKNGFGEWDLYQRPRWIPRSHKQSRRLTQRLRKRAISELETDAGAHNFKTHLWMGTS